MAHESTEREHTDEPDEELVRRAQGGDRSAMGALLARHEAWIFNLALRMVWRREDAEDATQEILAKVVDKLEKFEARSTVRTWVYRIAVRHLLNMRSRPSEERVGTFESFGERIRSHPDDELRSADLPVDSAVLYEESKLACMTGMLLCLAREQRIALILGSILGLDSKAAADILEIRPEAFRKRLEHARRDLSSFMRGQCGLVDPANPCRCARKTAAFIQAGVVDPHSLRFHREHVKSVAEAAVPAAQELEEGLALYRQHPFQESAGLAWRVVAALPDPTSRPGQED